MLTIAGSDSGGGAGIQADLKTFAAYGVHGLTAIAALTAQNTRAVTAVHRVPGALLEAQLEALFADFEIRAAKIGMLGDAATVRRVARVLRAHPDIPVVLDPVMVATSGARLLAPGAIRALVDELLPRAELITPNLPEAALLTGRRVESLQDYDGAFAALRAAGARAVLLKGGHLPRGAVVDVLERGSKRWRHVHQRLRRRGHGTGCTLAAAIAAQRAKGVALPAAVADAVAFVHGALKHGNRPGRGDVTVLDPFWRMRARTRNANEGV